MAHEASTSAVADRAGVGVRPVDGGRSPADEPTRPGSRPRRRLGEFSTIWFAVAALFLVSPLVAPGSLGSSAVLGMLPFAGVLAIAAIGQTHVVMQRGLDLSVPGVISLSALTVCSQSQAHGLAIALVIAILVGVAVGLLNAFVITTLSVTPFVATLGMNVVLGGVVLAYSGGKSPSAPAALSDIALAKTLGVPNLAIFAAVLAVIVSFVLSTSTPGRRFVLTGSNPSAAAVAGIRVRTYHAGAYVICSVCAAAAGVMLAGFLKTPSLQIGDTYLLASIAAVVLGGTSLSGGRGSAAATVGGALFLSQLDQVTQAMGAAQATQFLVQGAIIGLGMSLRSVPWARLRHSLQRPTRHATTTTR